jgi:hypothetical protein
MSARVESGDGELLEELDDRFSWRRVVGCSTAHYCMFVSSAMVGFYIAPHYSVDLGVSSSL